jgi:hypothetical protein
MNTTYKQTFIITIAAAAAAHFIVSVLNEPSVKTSLHGDIENVTKPFAQARISAQPVSGNNRPNLDLAFCIDTTGSMQGEIDTVKAKVKSVVAKLTSGQPKPNVRVGLVAYRDEGDDYVTKVFPFNDNIDQVVADISALNADGGGDTPESVDAGLHSAVQELDWDSSKHTAKLLFVIGDAPPHDSQALTGESKAASAKGIRINTIGCDGLERMGDQAVTPFREIATLTNGNYEPLSYHQEVVNASGKRETFITSAGVTFKTRKLTTDWKKNASYIAKAAPMLQGATNGTIGPQGSDATVISGVNTAGTVRVDNNLDDVMIRGAQETMGKFFK